MIIAAVAAANDCVVITDKENDFAGAEDLQSIAGCDLKNRMEGEAHPQWATGRRASLSVCRPAPAMKAHWSRAMILVVFGAGSSYDSVPSRPPNIYSRVQLANRPPLANELFLPNEAVLADNLTKFPQCHAIVPYLQVAGAETLESTLERLQNEGEKDPERKRQIAAVRYYLHTSIWECEYRWMNDVARGITNYVTLIDQLRRCRKDSEPVLLVTFNYDRILENALGSVNVVTNELGGYINHETFKLFKVHGSVHWAREVDTEIEKIGELNAWGVAYALIQRVAEIRISNRYRIFAHEHPISKIDDIPMFPAVAIPVETKRDFECPSDHLECLRTHVSKVTKIILIGWRGTENHFLKLLKDNLADAVRMQVVAGQRDWAEEILSRMINRGIADSGVSGVVDGGFTEYVVSREAERFLSKE